MTEIAEQARVPSVEKHRPAAAFYDLEGTLCSTNIVHTYAYFARNQPTLLRSVVKTVSTVAQIPFFVAADQYSRKVFNELFYRRYRGESEDRLKLMADSMFEEIVRPHIFGQSYHMIRQSREAGYRQVMITGALDLLAEPIARHLGMDDYVANELEYVNGVATGRLREPLIAGASKATYMRSYAKAHNLDLDQCLAYTDSMSDYPMLASVGKPSVINPDFRLKQLAKSFDWPILKFE
ncbi:MAG: HAD-IB family hydrolase [Myxococcota bacterium]